MTSTMVLAISTASSSFLHYSSSTGVKTSSHCFFSNSAISIPKKAIVQQINCISQLRFTSSSQWNGLKYTGISMSQYPTNIERKGKCKGKVVCASLFGVGAPEIMVIGVVALLVFGPKGLAEVARNLGKTLRTFQPTLRELQEVSREFKSTLEREIGLDDIDNPVPKSSSPTRTKPASSENTPEPNGSSSENGEDSIDDALKVKADLFRGALAQLQKEQEEEREKEKARSEAESQTPSQDTSQDLETPQEASSVTVTPPQNPDNAFQEAASVGPTTTSPAPKGETQI